MVLLRIRILVIMSMVVVLTGCASGVSNIPPLTLDEVAGRRITAMTEAEREGEIYRFVANRIVVDDERLVKFSPSDTAEVNRLLGQVNDALRGSRNGALSDSFTNYLLTEFARTPFEWQQTRVIPVGFDPASRLYFVDVVYTTTENIKRVVGNSRIPLGSPFGESMRAQRYDSYVSYLAMKTTGHPDTQRAADDFYRAWGSVAEVMREQQGISLLQRTRELGNNTGGIGRLTYGGMVDGSKLSTHAVMTVRFVMRHRFNLGSEEDLFVKAVYLKDFTLNNLDSIMAGYVLRDEAGVEVLLPFIDRLINSYHRAVESVNHIGLYQLYDDYGSIDKFYEDKGEYTYSSFGGYTFRIISRQGTNVVVEVNRIARLRARGVDMSLPTYEETIIFNLVLSRDDRIRIRNVVPVRRRLIGEPISVIRSVSGVSELIHFDGITFTDTNRLAVEEALKSFSQLVVNSEIGSPSFIEAVDLGVSQSSLRRMVDTITAIRANRKTSYIVDWSTKTNSFVSVRVREIFDTRVGSFDTEAVIDLVNRNGDWRVVSYVRTANVRVETVALDVENAFSVVERKE